MKETRGRSLGSVVSSARAAGAVPCLAAFTPGFAIMQAGAS